MTKGENLNRTIASTWWQQRKRHRFDPGGGTLNEPRCVPSQGGSLNHPEMVILGMNNSVERLMVRRGEVVARLMVMSQRLSLTGSSTDT